MGHSYREKTFFFHLKMTDKYKVLALLKAPCLGTSSENPQHVFEEEKEKENICMNPPLIWSYNSL